MQYRATDNAGHVEAIEADRVQGRRGQADGEDHPARGRRRLPARQGREGEVQVRRQGDGLRPRLLRRHRRQRPPIDTSTVGEHTFTVTGTDKAGNVTTVNRHYHVDYTWNGFFAPVTNTRVEAEPGARGRPDQARLRPQRRPRPERLRRRLPELGSGRLPGLDAAPVAGARCGHAAGLVYGVASGSLHLRLADEAAWAGTCREFQLQLNDGTDAPQRRRSCSSPRTFLGERFRPLPH